MFPVKEPMKIVTDETLREKVTHGNESYPFQYYLDDVWDFDFHSIDWHWHPEFEFLYVRQGMIRCFAGGETYGLPQGAGMFINSRVVHRFEADASAVMPNIVFSPFLLAAPESLIFQRYIHPVLQMDMPCRVFSPYVAWEKEVIDLLMEVFSLQEQEKPDALKTLQRLLALWSKLTGHLDLSKGVEEKRQRDSAQARLQKMIQYIHDHYQQAVTLNDIASSVFISKSSALQIFQNGIQLSPVAYLIQYRLKRAAHQLRSTDKRISVIAAECGFASEGYFCRKFRELFAMTPNEYRKMESIAGTR